MSDQIAIQFYSIYVVTSNYLLTLFSASVYGINRNVLAVVQFEGQLVENLQWHLKRVSSFSGSHLLKKSSDNDTFRTSVLRWHSEFVYLMVGPFAVAF